MYIVKDKFRRATLKKNDSEGQVTNQPINNHLKKEKRGNPKPPFPIQKEAKTPKEAEATRRPLSSEYSNLFERMNISKTTSFRGLASEVKGERDGVSYPLTPFAKVKREL
ncbi:hypothetical protein BOTCAL_0079g00300 [Botryotinia calthae]|uniref:Uncharacterized protein n=1 Tax=Botryotinia calthae TaxID=38488 RepID=A0A4Y8D864_9HELO|nr:hypothetical protein BOTCAL_0079g00300 [Botryotinia calthae]